MTQAYPSLLSEFQRSILEWDAQAAETLFRGNPKLTAAEQLKIYAEGYRLRLGEVVREDYPALRYYMGEAEFEALVQRYVESAPSRHFNIEKYPNGFAPFVKTAISDVLAQELAVLENAISMVYRMEESDPANPALLSQVPPEQLGTLRFPLRTAHQLFAFSYPVNAYLSAFREEKRPAKPQPKESYALVWRHNNTVQRADLQKEEYVLLRLLAQGHCLAEVFEHPEFVQAADMQQVAANVQKWFERWLSQGMIAA